MRIEDYAPSCIQWSRDSRRIGKGGGADIIITPGLNDTWSQKLCGVKINLVCGKFFYLENIGITKIIQKGEHFVYRGQELGQRRQALTEIFSWSLL